MSTDLLESVRREASKARFNLTGVASVAEFDAAALPDYRIRTVLDDAVWRPEGLAPAAETHLRREFDRGRT